MALSYLRLDEFLDVDIYESAAKLTQVGAGIGLFPRAWEILKDLGMAGDLEARLVPGEAPPDAKLPSETDEFSQQSSEL